MANSVQSRGVYCFKLPDPFCKNPYFSLSAKTIAELLGISERTALRICKGESKLNQAELVYLQMKIFGYIPDPDFLRYGVFFREGRLYRHSDNESMAVYGLTTRLNNPIRQYVGRFLYTKSKPSHPNVLQACAVSSTKYKAV